MGILLCFWTDFVLQKMGKQLGQVLGGKKSNSTGKQALQKNTRRYAPPSAKKKQQQKMFLQFSSNPKNTKKNSVGELATVHLWTFIGERRGLFSAANFCATTAGALQMPPPPSPHHQSHFHPTKGGLSPGESMKTWKLFVSAPQQQSCTFLFIFGIQENANLGIFGDCVWGKRLVFSGWTKSKKAQSELTPDWEKDANIPPNGHKGLCVTRNT